MSYHIYTTKALILSEYPRREADKMYALLTEDLGVIYATAGGVRKIESKLRASLQPYSMSNVSLVKGEDRWRIVSARVAHNLTAELSKEKLELFIRVGHLVKKLIPEEQPHKEIYQIIERGVQMAKEDIEPDVLEIVMLVEILAELGYISKENVPTVEEAKENRTAFISSINSALKETHLT